MDIRTKRSPSLTKQVVDDLMQKIADAKLHPGEKLPTEAELMLDYAVSRTVIREAISRLQAAGLVETKRGIGTFISEASQSSLPMQASLFLTLREIENMLELRIILESEAAGLAAHRRTNQHLINMEEALEQFNKDALRGDLAIDADYNFHLNIAKATNNPYFERVFIYLGISTIPRLRLSTIPLANKHDQSSAYLLKINEEHKAILKSIKDKDEMGARANMHLHLSNSQKRIKEHSRS